MSTLVNSRRTKNQNVSCLDSELGTVELHQLTAGDFSMKFFEQLPAC